MNNADDIRWKQRFANYKKALSQLKEFIDLGELSKFEKQGLIKSFEYTYELGWNTMKDYIIYQGNPDIGGSRDAIREGFKMCIITDGEGWMDMLKSRNRTSHTYDEDTAQEIIDAIIIKYIHLFEDLQIALSGKE